MGTIAQLCRAISLQLRQASTIGKNLLSSNISSRRSHNMVNFGVQAAEIDPVVCGTPAIFNGFRVLAAYARYSSSGRQPNFAALNRGRHLYLARRPSRWVLAHILAFYFNVCINTQGSIYKPWQAEQSSNASSRDVATLIVQPLKPRLIRSRRRIGHVSRV